MSSSPPKEGEAESEVAPPVVDVEQDQEENGPSHLDPPLELDIYGEVKEQDRWLPIANGWFISHLYAPPPCPGLCNMHSCYIGTKRIFVTRFGTLKLLYAR